MRVTAATVAEALGAEAIGDPDQIIDRAVHPDDADGASDLAVALMPDAIKALASSRAVTVLVPDGVRPPDTARIVIRTGTPRTAIPAVTCLFDDWLSVPPGIHPQAAVDPTAVIDPTAHIGPFCQIGPDVRIGPCTRLLGSITVARGAEIGADCLLYQGVRVAHTVRIGDRVIVHFNASLGADGFSYITPELGAAEEAKSANTITKPMRDIRRVHSLGGLSIADDVEIGALTAIDRGTFRDTRIGWNTKIDNLVQIGHNCVIAEEVTICGHSALAGSVRVGRGVVLGGKTGVPDHCRIGDNAVVAGGSGLHQNVPDNSVLVGSPAFPKALWFRNLPYLFRVREAYAQIRDLRRRLGRLEDRIGS